MPNSSVHEFGIITSEIYIAWIPDTKGTDHYQCSLQGGMVEKIKDKRNTEIETEKFRFITSHTFRRTALTNLYQGNPPFPEYLILNISGHSKSSQLHQYLGIDPNKEAQAREIRKWMERQKNTVSYRV